jgi:hypothetical protein
MQFVENYRQYVKTDEDAGKYINFCVWMQGNFYQWWAMGWVLDNQVIVPLKEGDDDDRR